MKRIETAYYIFNVKKMIEGIVGNDENFTVKAPNGDWELVQSELFENNAAVFLFETCEGEKYYYRYILVEVSDKECEILCKYGFDTRDGKRVKDFGLADYGISFLLKDEEKGADIICFDCNGKPCCMISGEDMYDYKKQYIILYDEKGKVVLTDMPAGMTNRCEYIDYIKSIYPEELQKELQKEADEAGDDGDDNDNENDDFDSDGDDGKISDLKGTQIKPGSGEEARKELNSLIGLNDVKDKINEICNYIDYIRLAEDYGIKPKTLCYNMVFEGNPGTAKTTVARLTAKIFRDKGITSNDCFYEAGRADMVAKYTGQTAVKVREVFKKAKGGVLFIDEAYSLTDGYENSFGDEAIATIVQEMENNRDTVVIFAGYTDRMEEFLSKNPGLRSRVPYRIRFEDYSVGELVEIAGLEAGNKGYTIDGEAIEKIKRICSSAINSDEFGNGRFCRNMIERAEVKHAARIMKAAEKRKPSKKAVTTLTADDFEAPCNVPKITAAKPLGFCA